MEEYGQNIFVWNSQRLNKNMTHPLCMICLTHDYRASALSVEISVYPHYSTQRLFKESSTAIPNSCLVSFS